MEAARGRDDVASTSKALEGPSFRQRRQHGYRSAPIRHLDGFAGFDTPQEFAGTLAELTNTYCSHVLFVAHRCALVRSLLDRHLLDPHDRVGKKLTAQWRGRGPESESLTFDRCLRSPIHRWEAIFTARRGWKRKGIGRSPIAFGGWTEPVVVPPFRGWIDPFAVETPAPSPAREVAERARADELHFLQNGSQATGDHRACHPSLHTRWVT